MSKSKRNNTRMLKDNDLCLSIKQKRLSKTLRIKRKNQELDAKRKRLSQEEK